jgi:hypothetical protein
MLGDAPGLRLFEAGRRIESGFSATDIPIELTRDTIFIIPSQLPKFEPQLWSVGTVLTERFPDARRLITGNKRNPQLILYIVTTSHARPSPGGQ